jgi:hypothetical protein
VLLGKHVVLARPADEQHVGLDDVDAREQHVERGCEHAAKSVPAYVAQDRRGDVQDDGLMPDAGGRRHVKLSVDELAAQAVVRHVYEVVVGALRARVVRRGPRHAAHSSPRLA